MKQFTAIALQIISVFLAIGIGYFVKSIKKNKINNDTLSELIIYVGSPCLAFTKLARSFYSASELGILFGAIFFIIAFSAVLTLAIEKLSGKKFTNIFYISTMFMNTANVGFPVTLFIFGAAGFQKAIILDLAMVIVLFSLGIALVSKKYWEWTRIPLFYAAVLGLICSFGKIDVPDLIFKPLALLGDIAVPLMLIALGSKLAELKKFSHLNSGILSTLLRSGGGLLAGLCFTKLFSITGLTRDVILLYSALPVPMMTYVLAQKYHQNENQAAEIVVVSNLAALLVLPVVIYLIKFVI